MKQNDERSLRQEAGIQKWINNKCRGTLCYCTGFGKTRTSILGIKRFLNKNPKGSITIVVPTELLKDQWQLVLSKNNIHTASVYIINTIVKKPFKTNLLIIDECHKYVSNTFYKLFTQCSFDMILGLTATFDRLDGKEVLLNKYCPVIDTVTILEAMKKGWLAKSTIYKVLIDVDNLYEYNEYNRMFLSYFSYFNYSLDIAFKCLKDYEYRISYVKEICLNNNFIFKDVLKECNINIFGFNKMLKQRKEFVHNHPKKIEITKRILESRPDSKAITFNATIKNCEKFDIGYIVNSNKTKKKNRLTLEEFSSIKKGVIHTAKSLTEGADIPGLNLAIILHNTSSSTERIQKYGRVIRAEGDKTAEIFSLVIKGTVEENWFKSSAKNTNFIEINEDELNYILKNKIIDKNEEIQEETKYILTY